MRFEELMIVLLIAGALLVMPVAALIVSIVSLTRTRRITELTKQVAAMDAYLRRMANTPAENSLKRPPDVTSSPANAIVSSDTAQPAASAATAGIPKAAESPVAIPASSEVTQARSDLAPAATLGPQHSETAKLEPTKPAATKPASATSADPGAVAATVATVPESSPPIGWETFIGQKAFGWLAVVLFLFSATFFLRYAYQNNWIGPVGRVAIAEIFGVALVLGGHRYLLAGWRRFSTMLISAGIVVIYLATYSAFAFYHLLPQNHAGLFLTLVILESMIAAVYCRSAVIGMVAVIGGLLTPLLMVSDYDSYSSFFIYLAALNFGVVVALCLQRWKAVGSVAFYGAQALFWMWYETNYHPEKFGWTLGFQMLIFGLYLGQTLVVARFRRESATVEDLVRIVLNAVLGFVAFRVLTIDDYGIWIGSAALVAATLYAMAGRMVLVSRLNDQRLLLTLLSVSIGFIAWAIPVQADVRWIALGWMMMGVASWLFGQRISSPMLRLMAAAFACCAVGRLLAFDLPLYVRDPFIPVFNRVAFPSLLTGGLLLAAVWMSDRYLPRLSREEKLGIGVAGVTGTTLLWLLLSLECHGYFVSQSMYGGDVGLWRWRAQLALTVLWTVFAILLMFAGFRFHRSRLRWLAMILFGVTAIKLFAVDMANVQQIYRIVGFFILAVVLGVVARAYQRFR